MIGNQAEIFLIFIINGFLIGFLFDFFRILRKSFKTKDFTTNIEDFIFWALTGAVILYSIFTFNNGQIRLYMFIAVIIGIILYMILFSKHVIKVNVFVIKYLKKIFKILLKFLNTTSGYIFKIIRKIIFKPIYFIVINIKNSSTYLYKNKLKMSNKIKNKEGF